MGLVKQFLERTNARVVATSRCPDEAYELHELKKTYDEARLLTPKLDVQDDGDFQRVKDFLGSQGIHTLDIIIGNAGISNATHPHNPFLECTREDMREVFETNVIGNMRLLQVFHDMLTSSSLRLSLIMSSSLGSYTNAAELAEGSTIAYRCSKAALNMLAVLYASEPSVKESGVKVIILHPGWVKTDMGLVGGQPAKIDIEESTEGILELVERAIQFQASKIQNNTKGEGTKGGVEFQQSSADEIEGREHLNEFISHLDSNNFAFVRYDGQIIQW